MLSLIVSLTMTDTDHVPTDRPIVRHWESGTGWFVFLAIPAMGVVWAWLVRCLLARSSNLHKTHYNLSEMKTPVGGSHVVVLRSSGHSPASHGTSGRGNGGREKLKTEVHSTSTGKTGFPWKRTLRNPSIMYVGTTY